MISWFNVLEGGKRGSKNVVQSIAFAACLDEHPNRIHLVGGVTGATAKINILDCDGVGLLYHFAGRCREGKYKDRDCLYINSRVGEKIVLVSGGGKNGDEKLIKGNTYGMAMITEANECAPSFLKEAFDRTLSSQDRKVFHDLNPKDPNHWYYAEILDHHEEMQRKDPLYGYNYGHTTIADNMSIDDQKLKAVLKTYDKGSVWYLRDILGKRQRAEGLIYTRFANHKADYKIKDVPHLMEVNVGLDFGGNKSAHALVASGITPGYKKIIALKSRRYFHKDYKEGIAPSDIDQFTVDFVGEVIEKYGRCDYLYWDNEAVTLGTGIKRALEKAYPQVTVQGCHKAEINDRIELMRKLIGEDRFFYTEDCQTLVSAIETAVWDDKAPAGEDVRLDDGTTDIDSLDGFEYTFTRNMKRFIQ